MLYKVGLHYFRAYNGLTIERTHSAFDIAVEDGDYEVIYNYFDDLFNICRYIPLFVGGVIHFHDLLFQNRVSY